MCFLCVVIDVVPKLFPILLCLPEIFSRDHVSYSGGFYNYDSIKNKYAAQDAARDAERAAANQRAKARYDARTWELKAEYDARTAAGWGKDRAAQNFKNDAAYWRGQQKKYR